MGIAQLIFQKGNYISTIELDIIINESATSNVRLTENPVENGANVNDHIIIEPMTFTTVGVVSDISSSVIGQFTRVPTIFSQNSAKSKDAWEALLKLQRDRTPFTLTQGLKSYENVVILSITESQDKDTSKGLFFTAQMKELIQVGSAITKEDQFNEQSIADKMVAKIKGGLKQLEELLT